MTNTYKGSLFALLCLASLAGSAHAQPDTQTLTMKVSTDGLDLTAPAGRKALHHRLAVAVRSVCGPTEMVGAPMYNDYVHCIDQASAAAGHLADVAVADARGGRHYALLLPNAGF